MESFDKDMQLNSKFDKGRRFLYNNFEKWVTSKIKFKPIEKNDSIIVFTPYDTKNYIKNYVNVEI
jgi:hypothetical protein